MDNTTSLSNLGKVVSVRGSVVTYGSMSICRQSTRCYALEMKGESSLMCWRNWMRIVCAGLH
jgi:predicted extracellular nuclease